MNYTEFADLINPKAITPDDFESVVHPVYQFHPLIPDVGGKDKIAALFHMGGIGLMRDMLPTARRFETLESEMRQARQYAVRTEAAYRQAKNYYVEVWIEKDALVGVIEGVCREEDVPYFSCRGYTSQSEVWRAARRLADKRRKGKDCYILHLGDHDPSGIDMTRDIDDRLTMFMGGVGVKRLALNMDQVQRYNPPPNPAKITDSRGVGYIATHGRESWELDALEPTVIGNLIRSNVVALRDADLWTEAKEREESARLRLTLAANHWPQIEDFMDSDIALGDVARDESDEDDAE